MRVFYIVNYSHADGYRNLKTTPSSITKINYILSVLEKVGIQTSVYSLAPSASKTWKFYKKEKVCLNKNIEIYYPFLLGEPNFIWLLVARIVIYIQFIWFVFFQVKKTDYLLVYHSLQYRYFIRIIRLLKKCRIFFEIEEIYGAVYEKSQLLIDKEIKYLQGAEGYILVNDLMNEKCRLKSSNYCVCYGDYRLHVGKERKLGKNIDVVYAGVIGKEGTDVYLAMDSMLYLPTHYNLFILGYGASGDINKMNAYILEINRLLGRECVSYEGCLSGKAYSDFLLKCDIGLCIRVLPDCYSDFTFPSKVLVYLGHGLIPVCSPIKCIQSSKIASSVVFCKEVLPQSVAEAILSVFFMDDKNILSKLDTDFTFQLRAIFK